MKKILLLLFITILSIWVPYTAKAGDNIDPKLTKAYSKFITKLEKKYNPAKQQLILNKLSKKLENIKKNKKLSSKQTKTINDILTLTNEKIFYIQLDQKIEEGNTLLNSFSLRDKFKKEVYSKENIFLENWVWYSYLFNTHLSFQKWVKIREQDLTYNKIDVNNYLLFPKEDGTTWFVKDYNKIKLISDDIIFWTPNKFQLLTEIKDDKMTLWEDTDKLFIELKAKTKELTKGVGYPQ